MKQTWFRSRPHWVNTPFYLWMWSSPFVKNATLRYNYITKILSYCVTWLSKIMQSKWKLKRLDNFSYNSPISSPIKIGLSALKLLHGFRRTNERNDFKMRSYGLRTRLKKHAKFYHKTSWKSRWTIQDYTKKNYIVKMMEMDWNGSGQVRWQIHDIPTKPEEVE
jgi:hypothetical protein